MKLLALAAALAVLGITSAAQAVIYTGNGSTDFGGPAGTGSLELTNDGTTLFGTWTKGSGTVNDVLVLYIDSVPGGFSSTTGFTDAGDGLRRAASGFDGGTNRSVLTMPAGFEADHALSLGPDSDDFGAHFTLVNGGGHTYGTNGSNGNTNLTPTGNNNSATYTFSLPLANIGNPTSFQILGTYISNTGYRSLEFLPGAGTGTQGYNPFTATSAVTYVVPEPGSLTLAGMAALGLLRRRR